ncbi:MAG: tetratricopeptide repeat protein [bacterium]
MTEGCPHQALRPYLPRTLWNWYAVNPPDAVHSITAHEGIVACIDASGFTALTRRLAAQGQEGPEILTKILDRFFGGVGEVVFEHGGDILKFAGDAIWVALADTVNLPLLLGRLMRAVENVNRHEPRLSDSPLRIHVGAELGSYYLVSLGDPERRLEAEPAGEMLKTVYAACDLAGDGQLVVGSRLAHTLRAGATITALDDGYALIKNVPTDTPLPKKAPAGEIGRSDSKYVTKYLSPEVLARLDGADGAIQSEHRQVVTLFANVESLSGQGEADLRRLQAKVRQSVDIIGGCRGSLTRIDPYQGGHKILVLFGTPVRYAQYEMDAIKCAGRLANISDRGFRIRIGLALGPLFCGDVGARLRREYTVMGDGINLAARLMSKAAWGSILIDDRLRQRLSTTVVTQPQTKALKGVGENVVCHRFCSFDAGIAPIASLYDIREWVGQENELQELSTWWHQAASSSGQRCLVEGESGVGKTTLLRRLADRIRPPRSAFVSCREAVLFDRGWSARRLLESLIGSEHADVSLDDWIVSHVDRQWSPLLGPILKRTMADNDWTQGLTPELRRGKAQELFAQLVAKAARPPMLVVIDDIDRADDFSRMLFEGLRGDTLSDGMLLIATATASEEVTGAAGNDAGRLTLKAPSGDQWWGYYERHFDPGTRERDLFDRLLTASDGNPLFINEYIRQCRCDGTILENRVTGKLELARSDLKISVPEDSAAGRMAAFDQLPETTRRVLKVAAVIGRSFDYDLVAQVLEESVLATVAEAFQSAIANGMVICSPSDGCYTFQDASLSEAIYNCIPKAELRHWHGRCGELLSADGDQSTALPAYHFGEAGRVTPGFGLALDAAVKALDEFALNESARFFGYCLELAGADEGNQISADQQSEFFRHYHEFLVMEGRYPEAYAMLRRWRRIARDRGVAGEAMEAALQTAELLWKQSRYDRTRRLLAALLAPTEAAEGGHLRARTTSLMAELERRAGNFAEARRWAQAAAEAALKAGDDYARADALNKQGLAFWGEGQLQDAAECYHQSIKIGRQKGNRYDQAKSSNNLAIIKWELGDFQEADRLLGEAVGVFRDTGDRRNEAYACGNLASLQKIFGRLKQSESLFNRADQIFERLGDRHAHLYTVGNLGDLDVICGRLEAASDRYQQALEFSQEVDDKELQAECWARLGDVAFFENDWEKAGTLYNQAIAIAGEIGSTEYLIRATVGQARLQIGLRQSEAALGSIDSISTLADKNSAVLAHHEALFLRGEHGRIADQANAAAEAYQQVLDYALSQGIFELTVKSAARIAAIKPSQKPQMERLLVERAHQFDRDNGPGSWQTIVNSCYLAHFAGILQHIQLTSLSAMVPNL